MPIPIMPVKNMEKNNSGIDYSILFNQPVKKTVTASNDDAALLFELWEKGERGKKQDVIKVNLSEKVTSKDILRLKTMGFITGNQNEIEFTKKGKMVITTMSLGEGSKFEKNKMPKSYTEILASMNKRNKKGYRIPKFAANTSNNLDIRGI